MTAERFWDQLMAILKFVLFADPITVYKHHDLQMFGLKLNKYE